MMKGKVVMSSASGKPTGREFPCRLFRRSADTTRIAFTIDGDTVWGFEGETLLAALMSERGWSLRRTEVLDRPRGMFCAMGSCMDCLVHIEGEGIVRACMVFVRQGLVCRTLVPVDGAGYQTS